MTEYIVFRQTGEFEDDMELVNRVMADSPEKAVEKHLVYKELNPGLVREAGTNGEYWAVASNNITSYNKTADRRPR